MLKLPASLLPRVSQVESCLPSPCVCSSTPWRNSISTRIITHFLFIRHSVLSLAQRKLYESRLSRGRLQVRSISHSSYLIPDVRAMMRNQQGNTPNECRDWYCNGPKQLLRAS